jgi:agmatine deiminase
MTGLRMPGEFAPHERTVMCWPCRDEIYPGRRMAEARAAHVEVARTIQRFEPVTMIARPGADAADAAAACGAGVEIVELPIDDSWFRDTGPIFVTDPTVPDRNVSDPTVTEPTGTSAMIGGGRIALDWAFNGWGEKFAPFDRDAAVGTAWAELAGHRTRSLPMVLEGGSINVDGAGTGVTTVQCLMHPNRNPSMTQSEIEATLHAELGLSRVLWLPHGLALDDDTDGHVDNVAAFARPGVLVVQGCDDPDEDDHLRMNVNARVADGWVDGRGDRLAVVEIPVLPFVERDGDRLAVPYVNYYVGNGFVVVPTCGHPADGDMLAIIADQYPGRETIALDVGAILAIGGGGIHCITQQVPR